MLYAWKRAYGMRADARHERRAGAQDGHEARQHDGHRAVLEEERLGAPQVLDLEEADLAAEGRRVRSTARCDS